MDDDVEAIHPPERRPGRPGVLRLSKTRCACGKWAYLCRRDARRAARALHPGEHLRAYPCRTQDAAGAAARWHLGHPRLA